MWPAQSTAPISSNTSPKEMVKSSLTLSKYMPAAAINAPPHVPALVRWPHNRPMMGTITTYRLHHRPVCGDRPHHGPVVGPAHQRGHVGWGIDGGRRHVLAKRQRRLHHLLWGCVGTDRGGALGRPHSSD